MGNEIKITYDKQIRIGEYEPGNGTRYTTVAIPWHDHESLIMGCLGTVSNGWLVVSGNTGKAYLFQREGFLLDTYIQEHLGGSFGDYPHFGDLVRKLVDRPLPGVPLS